MGTSLLNIARQVVRKDQFPVMWKKAWSRVGDRRGLLDPEQNLAWLSRESESFEPLARSLDPMLWEESLTFANGLEESASEILAAIDENLGGGGDYSMLYFLTRLREPENIVETGVAAGFTSAAILAAVQVNGHGSLHSSDFPYFRLKDPESLIGVLVEDSLKEPWHLHIKGDEQNLPRILADVDEVDLFHYDSDKSYMGRLTAISRVRPKMAPEGVVIMDDIQDNSFFHDWVMRTGGKWRVFAWHDKFIGVVGI